MPVVVRRHVWCSTGRCDGAWYGLLGWRDAKIERDVVIDTVEHEGWSVESRRAPLGVVGFVFEGRPNVFADACGVVRTGNAVVFRIGSDALGTARAIVEHALDPALAEAGLPAGAASVVAIDVGRHQLHERLRADERVAVHEQTNIRHADVAALGGPADIVVADLSFISLRLVAASIRSFVREGGDLVLLVKPQFEAGKAEADRGRGVIRDPEIWRRTLHDACTALNAAGTAIMGVMVSPITGGDGNVEFLVHCRATATPLPLDTDELAARCDRAVAEAAR